MIPFIHSSNIVLHDSICTNKDRETVLDVYNSLFMNSNFIAFGNVRQRMNLLASIPF